MKKKKKIKAEQKFQKYNTICTNTKHHPHNEDMDFYRVIDSYKGLFGLFICSSCGKIKKVSEKTIDKNIKNNF